MARSLEERIRTVSIEESLRPQYSFIHPHPPTSELAIDVKILIRTLNVVVGEMSHREREFAVMKRELADMKRELADTQKRLEKYDQIFDHIRGSSKAMDQMIAIVRGTDESESDK